jgi:hypothetical protein
MSSNDANKRKRKPTTIPETVSSNDDQNPKEGKCRRVSTTNALASTAALLQVDTPATPDNVTAVNAVSTATKDDESIRSVGKVVEDLCLSDNAIVNAALDALSYDFMKDKKKRESFVTAGGCLALVQLLTKCLDKAIETIPACDEVTDWNELAELTTILATLDVITGLTFRQKESKDGISTIGGVEAVIKVMKTFPKCQILQQRASIVLVELAICSIGNAKAIESGGIEVLLAAINKHLGSPFVCENACWALYSIVKKSKENTELLITLGGGAAVAKVRRKWPENNDVQFQVRKLVNMFAAEWKAWGDENEDEDEDEE